MLERALILSVYIYMLGSIVWAEDYPLWKAYNNNFINAKYVDLTHAFSPHIPVWSGFEKAKFAPARAGMDLPSYTKKG